MYTVYKTINTVTNEYYIGVHKTNNPNDGYYGSGIHIVRQIAKYGKEQFIKEILFIFETKEEAFDKEVKLLKEKLTESLCLNISNGGEGGDNFLGKKHTQQTKDKIALAITKRGGIKKTPEQLMKERKTRLLMHDGEWCSDEARNKMARKKLGIPRPQWVKDKIKATALANKLKKGDNWCSNEARDKMARQKLGIPRPQWVKDKIRATMLAKKNINAG